jgi:hypothetical protein
MKLLGYRKLLVLAVLSTVVTVAQATMPTEAANHLTAFLQCIGGIYLGGQSVIDTVAPLAAAKQAPAS